MNPLIKPLVSEAEKERKKNKRNYILIGFILLLLVASSASFAFISNPTPQTNTGSSSPVTSVGGKYALQYGAETIYFTNSPEQTNNISTEILFTLNNYYSQPLYIATESDLIYYEISSTLGRYPERVQHACYGPCNLSYAEKNCTENLIVINPNIENKVTQQDKCVFIEGDMRAVDAFLYKIFGVKKQ